MIQLIINATNFSEFDRIDALNKKADLEQELQQLNIITLHNRAQAVAGVDGSALSQIVSRYRSATQKKLLKIFRQLLLANLLLEPPDAQNTKDRQVVVPVEQGTPPQQQPQPAHDSANRPNADTSMLRFAGGTLGPFGTKGLGTLGGRMSRQEIGHLRKEDAEIALDNSELRTLCGGLVSRPRVRQYLTGWRTSQPGLGSDGLLRLDKLKNPVGKHAGMTNSPFVCRFLCVCVSLSLSRALSLA